ncbi:hypothetical protein HN51_063302 [Arachis hypogaea]|uniref:Uncharacterized protein n=1 Tax=Arachis hypogaea TaxID=3818 RepID=A0A445AYN7_ARAHY|nr:uncharacterized protein LOC107619537 [Arachis ipaensis]XP_025629630.1 uncharacterized protein LOC112722717 [Arachis hypogaea]QHO20910.1 uncharacterized protein DS421_11g342050 [Arachis hypogaea]RYR31518.1 hypothetical protein Ahy_B01g056322 [Arachis hypogaea]
MASWKKTIATPFKKACTFFNNNNQPTRENNNNNNNKKSTQTVEEEKSVMDLHGEVMACGYEDVRVMWSILDKSKSTAPCNITSS